MKLSAFDLGQIDSERLGALNQEQLVSLVMKLASDLREALDRLNENSRNSSRPPSSEEPWSRKADESREGKDAEVETGGEEPASAGRKLTDKEAGGQASGSRENPEGTPEKPRAGRQKGAQGHSRRVSLAVTGEQIHRPEQCGVCGQELDTQGFVARAGLYVLEVVLGGMGLLGLGVRHEKHVYGDIECGCGHVNRTEPGRCGAEAGWDVELTEWHLVGPTLSALIVCLSQRMLVSRARIQEFVQDWLGVYLSTSTLNQCLHEAGRAVAPVEEQIVEELQQAYQAHCDETPWKEWGKLVWLWVMTTPSVCLYLVGSRGKEMIEKSLGAEFVGWLMTDGYQVYRKYKHRLRCWAHLLRKARGLAESLNQQEAQPFGQQVLGLLEELMQAVYTAREGNLENLQIPFAERLEEFKRLCQQYRDSPHQKTRELAREFLNDWDVIWVVLQYPWLPLTNNEAERALRHWVIARRISYGTRTAQGSRAFALLASVIETCRKRHVSPWAYLAEVIAERRKGNPAPLLPAPCPA